MGWCSKFLLGICIMMLLVSSGCAEKESYSKIDLQKLEPTAQTIGTEQDSPLTVALASITSPKESIIYYGELLQYLEDHLGRPVKVIQRKTYKEVNDLIAAGKVDLSFICTYSYIQGTDDIGLDAFLVPLIDGKTTYQSYIIVSAGSSISEFKDLKYKKFAFTDPDSTTGYLYPKWLVKEMGETSETFFSSTFFTHSHDNSIKAVVDGVVDGAAIDGLILDYILEKQPEFLSQVKVINKSKEFGMPPVVISPEITDVEHKKIKKILTSMHLEPRGKEILERIRIESFVPQDDRAYDSVRELAREVFTD